MLIHNYKLEIPNLKESEPNKIGKGLNQKSDANVLIFSHLCFNSRIGILSKINYV